MHITDAMVEAAAKAIFLKLGVWSTAQKEAARAAITAALSQDEWQPIETFPKEPGQYLVTAWEPGEAEYGEIELVQGPFLRDGRIANVNSCNYTNPGVWKWWRHPPALPPIPTQEEG